MGVLSEFLFGYVLFIDGKFRKRVVGFWGVDDFLMERGFYFIELWDVIEKGDVRVFYIVGENLVVSEVDFMRVRRVLRNFDLFVV